MNDSDNMWSAFPLKNSMIKFSYETAFGHLPMELKEKLNKANTKYGNIMDI